jgi:heat shock protein HtpX
MAQREFGRDTGLQARMLLTMFLLGVVYVILIGVAVTAGAGIGLIVVIVAVLLGAQLFASDKIALAAMGAREVTPAQAPELHQIIERLCIQADLPKPRVALVEAKMPNAFALGRSQKSATVCATTGLLSLLSPAELEGVLAHELTHVLNRDVMVMTIASFFASIAAILVRFGLFFGGRRNQQSPLALVLVVSLAVYAASFMLLRALSRYREYAADRGAAVITGRPSALSSALVKISGTLDRIPSRDLRTAAQMNAFFIVPARVKSGFGSVIGSVIGTHPPLEKRIERLNRLESQLQN